MALTLNIFQIHVIIKSPSIELINRLTKDFEHYISKANGEADILVEHLLSGDLSQSFNTAKLINYTDETKVMVDRSYNQACIVSSAIESTHEICYLYILSRVGKILDLKNIHRIHAMALAKDDIITIGVGNSGVGKSTLFTNALTKSPLLKALSDDTPLVTTDLNFYPFPLRIGISKELAKLFQESVVTTMDRKKYGKKYLLSAKTYPFLEGHKKFRRINLLYLTRSPNQGLQIRKCSHLKMFFILFKYMIIGFGLPIIKEFFIEWSLVDLFRLTSIFIKRVQTAIALLFRSNIYTFNLSNNQEENHMTLMDLFEEKVC